MKIKENQVKVRKVKEKLVKQGKVRKITPNVSQACGPDSMWFKEAYGKFWKVLKK